MEDARIDFYLLDTGTVEFFQGCDDAGFFAGARGPIDEEVGEVAGLCLCRDISFELEGTEENWASRPLFHERASVRQGGTYE